MNEKSGWVDFPEGDGPGAYVQLVVLDRDGSDWMKAAGGYSRSPDDAEFAGWDKEPDSEGFYSHPREWVYLAQLTIGSVSGCDPFVCSYSDLDEDGKALYDQVKKLYGAQGEVYLQTWVDA